MANDLGSTLEALDRQVEAILGATTPAEVFRALLEGTRIASPRAAVFLAREGLFRGWGAVGYSGMASGTFRRARSAPELGWMQRALSVPRARATREIGETGPEFGQLPSEEAVALSVRAGDRVVALVLAERSSGEHPWLVAALGLLVSAARGRLEFELAWRRVRVSEASAARRGTPPPESAVDVPAPDASAPTRPTEERRTPENEMVPWTKEPSSTPVSRRRDEARRFARLVATDIRLYNEESVRLGRQNGDLEERLREHLERGRETFQRRFADLGPEGEQILRDFFVQVLAGGDARLIS